MRILRPRHCHGASRTLCCEHTNTCSVAIHSQPRSACAKVFGNDCLYRAPRGTRTSKLRFIYMFHRTKGVRLFTMIRVKGLETEKLVSALDPAITSWRSGRKEACLSLFVKYHTTENDLWRCIEPTERHPIHRLGIAAIDVSIRRAVVAITGHWRFPGPCLS